MESPRVEGVLVVPQSFVDEGTDYRQVVNARRLQLSVPERLRVVVAYVGHERLKRVDLLLELRSGPRYQIGFRAIEPVDDRGVLANDLDVSSLRTNLADCVASEMRIEFEGGVYDRDFPVHEVDEQIHPDDLAMIRVAVPYASAVLAGHAPLQHLHDRLNITPAAAATRVKVARQAGFLNPTTPGKVA